MTGATLMLLGLGALHGVNPGMGWLFAVALGLQQGQARAVWRALAPLALGHLLAVAAAAMVVLTLGRALSPSVLEWGVAGLLVLLGIERLFRGRHPSWAAMRVGPADLTLWSFLMASAHGAGLMVVPLLLEPAHHGLAHQSTHAAHVLQASITGAGQDPLTAAVTHTAGYLLATGLIALLVYQRLGLKRLRAYWINLDLLWGGALVVTGVLTAIL